MRQKIHSPFIIQPRRRQTILSDRTAKIFLEMYILRE